MLLSEIWTQQQKIGTVLELSIKITDIWQLFNSKVDYFFKLSIKIVDYLIPGNKENSLLNFPGSGIPLNSDIKFNDII